MAAGGGARLPAPSSSSSFPAPSPSASASDASAASRLTLLPCARYEQRLSKRFPEGTATGCSDPLLLNYDPFVCPNPRCKTKGEAARGGSLGMLNCGCIMCDMCMNKPFVGFAGKNDGKCPVCESTVFKEQSKTKIGGMMLRYKRPKALEEWNDPHVKGEQRTREAVYEQLDDKTFREIFMPLCEAAAARAGCAFVEEPLAVVMRERDAEIERLKRRIDALERAVRTGDAAAIAEQSRLQSDLKNKMKQKSKDRAEMVEEVKRWEDFRERREEIVLDKQSHDRSRKEKAEQVLRDYMRVKEEHVKRAKVALALPREAATGSADPAFVGQSMPASKTLEQKNTRKLPAAAAAASGASLRRSGPSLAEQAAGGYSDSVVIARARRECWMGHGFKPVNSSGSGSGSGGGGAKQQPRQQQQQQQKQQQQLNL